MNKARLASVASTAVGIGAALPGTAAWADPLPPAPDPAVAVQGTSSFSVLPCSSPSDAAERLSVTRPYYSWEGGDTDPGWVYVVDGQEVSTASDGSNTFAVTPGTHTLELLVGGQQVDVDTFETHECPSPSQPSYGTPELWSVHSGYSYDCVGEAGNLRIFRPEWPTYGVSWIGGEADPTWEPDWYYLLDGKTKFQLTGAYDQPWFRLSVGKHTFTLVMEGKQYDKDTLTGKVCAGAASLRSATLTVTKKPTSKKAGRVKLNFTSQAVAKINGRAVVTIRKGASTKRITVKVRNGTATARVPKLARGVWKFKATFKANKNFRTRDTKTYRVRITK